MFSGFRAIAKIPALNSQIGTIWQLSNIKWGIGRQPDSVIVYPIAPFATRRHTVGSILPEPFVVRELLSVFVRRKFRG